MSDPDLDWKPSNRPQSTIALNFMSELDSLFNLSDSSLDVLDKTVSEKKQAVNTHTAELEALEAQLRAAEQRLHQAQAISSSPLSSPPLPTRRDSQRRTPVQDHFPLQDKARQSQSQSQRDVRVDDVTTQ